MNNVPGNIKLDDFLQNHILTNLKIDDSWTFGLYFAYIPSTKCRLLAPAGSILLSLADLSIEKLDLPFEPDDYTLKHSEIISKVFRDDRTCSTAMISKADHNRTRRSPSRSRQFAFDSLPPSISAL